MDSNEQAGNADGRSNGMTTASESSPSTGPTFPDTATSPPSIGPESSGLTFWQEASLVSRSARPGNAKVKRTKGGSGRSSSEPFAHFDPATSSWRTSRTSWLSTEDRPSERLSEAWPRAGTTRNGTAYQLRPSVPYTNGIESGSWPTPDAGAWALGADPVRHRERQERLKAKHKNGNGAGTPLAMAVLMPDRWPTPTVAMYKGSSLNTMTRRTGASRLNDRLDYSVEHGQIERGRLNPTWVEWLMGFPLGWTDLGPSETRSSRKSSK